MAAETSRQITDILCDKLQGRALGEIVPVSESVLPARLIRLTRLARARLIWETYAPILAVPVLAVSVFLIVTVLGAWEVAGDPLRLLALLGTVFAIARGVYKARALRFPTRSDVMRRLEKTASLDHRPLDVLQDKAILAPDLWPVHVLQARAKADTIRTVGRVPSLSPMDRMGLRFIMPILLGLAVFLALGVGLERVRHAVTPRLLPITNPYNVTFEAWVDPPDYTGRPPIYAQGDGVIRAPVGSTLVVRASGAKNLPRPRFIGERTRFLRPSKLGQNSVEVRTVIDGSGVLDWRIGPTRKQFTIDAAPDAPPFIESIEPPEADKRDRLVLVFNAADDYGVERVLLEMVELTDALEEATAFAADGYEFDTESGGFVEVEGRTIKLDMTRHPLAGKKVIARLVAEDGAAQRANSEPFYTTIPDKIFVEPLAKAIVEQRTLLLAGEQSDWTDPPKSRPDTDASDGTFDTYQTAWRLGRAPAPVQRSAELIEAVTDVPDPGLFNDPVVYIGLRHVGKALRYAKSAEALQGLPDHMWKLAIRAEFGVLGTALQEMQEAEAALREGIARRAPQREIDTLFERYNQAVDAYMEELRRNATVSDEESQGGGGSPMGSTDQIQELLDAIEEANRNGDTEGARRALAQLAELLENMQIQLSQGSGSGEGQPSGDSEMTEEQRQQLEDLAESLGEQRDLQDETQQAERNELRREFGEEPGGESVSPEELAQRQAEIESLIEGLQERLSQDGDRSAPGEGDAGDQPGAGEGEGDQSGQRAESGDQSGGSEEGEVPGSGGRGELSEEGTGSSSDAFARARDAMRESEQALREGDLRGSRQAQGEAIRALRDAGDALSEELAAQMDNQNGDGDPLGRGLDGFDSDNAESDIDTRSNAERSREILEELRRRAAEAEREQQEQDYLERLLERF